MCYAGTGEEKGVFIATDGEKASPGDLLRGNPLSAKKKAEIARKGVSYGGGSSYA